MKTLLAALFCFLCITLRPDVSLAQGNSPRESDPDRSVSVDFSVQKGKVIITYELKTDLEDESEAEVVLRRKSDVSFSLSPEVMEGDLEDIQSAGKKTIIWEPTAEEKKKLIYDDFYFQVILNSSGSSWYYYVGGVLAAGAAAAVFLNKENSKDKTSTTVVIPDPPARP